MKAKTVIIVDEDGFVERCYDLEASYTEMVIQDLIDKAVEEQS